VADDRRSLILDLLARAKTKQGTSEAAGDLDRLAGAAEEADRKTVKLGETSEKVGHQTDKMGNSLSETTGRISKLDHEIAGVEKEIKGLSASFADADDAAQRIDLTKSIRKSQNDLRNLKKNRGILADLLPDTQEIEKEGKRVEKDVQGVFEGVSSSLAPVITGAAVAAAPAIGAVLAGAVIGGAGLTGIAGGFLLASKDPRVKTGLDQLKQHIGDELKGAAEPFVPVAIDAFSKVRRAIDTINFGAIFKDAAAQAGPLVDGVTTLITKLGSGVTDLIHNAGPEIKVIGAGIAEIGSAIGDGLHTLSTDGKQGADALSNLFLLIDGGIRSTFALVDGLAKVYGWLREISHGGIIDAFRSIMDAQQGVADKTHEVAANVVGAISGTNDLAKAQDDASRAAYGQRDALSAVAKELRAQTDPAFAVLDATDKVRDAQKEAADATKKYGRESEQARAANRKLAEAAIDLQGNVGALGQAFDGHLTPTMRRTLQAAGLTKSQIKAVEGELRRAKAAADAYAGRYVAEIITNYTYNVGGNDYNREANRGSFSKRAAGGPVVRGKPYIVGENGPEIVVPDDSGRVLSAGASRGLMVQGAMTGLQSSMGGGGTVQEVRLTVDGNDQRLVSLLKYLIRSANLIEA